MSKRRAPVGKSSKAKREELRKATRLLEALVEDRRLLDALPEGDAVRLKKAAGRLSRPDRLEQMKTAKRARIERRRRLAKADRATRGESRIRRGRA